MTATIICFAIGSTGVGLSLFSITAGKDKKWDKSLLGLAVLCAVCGIFFFGLATFLAAPKELGWHTQLGVDGSTLSYPAPNR